jgi:hypothetical protein
MVRAEQRERKTETERERGRLACARHLKDLKRAHTTSPPDVRIRPTSTPVRLAATPASSNCTSPGALCAELMS